MKKMKSNIVITAFGAVTPLGGTYEEIAHALWIGKSGIKKIHKFNTHTFVTHHAGIPDEGNESMHSPGKRSRSSEMLYADLAAKRLLSHALFPHRFYLKEKIGCIIGVDEPALDLQLILEMKNDKKNLNKTMLEKMIRHFRIADGLNLEPSAVLNSIYNVIPFAGYATTHLGLCSASLQAIGMGTEMLESGSLEAVIVGGVSGKVNPLNLARLEMMDVISTDTHLLPEQRSRPFDNKRSGFVLAEGAILFLLEKEENVLKRGDVGLLKILGYGSSLSAEHIVAPHQKSLEMVLSMQRALNHAAISPTDADLINAHGTSTVLNDLHEASAIHQVFSNHKHIPVTANKSLHGHMIAAAGAMEILNTLVSLNEGFIPGSINLDQQDELCAINIVKQSRKEKINIVLKNSFGMGGLAASLIVGRI